MTHAQINALRRRTGFVFQNYNLFANKTALAERHRGADRGAENAAQAGR